MYKHLIWLNKSHRKIKKIFILRLQEFLAVQLKFIFSALWGLSAAAGSLVHQSSWKLTDLFNSMYCMSWQSKGVICKYEGKGWLLL